MGSFHSRMICRIVLVEGESCRGFGAEVGEHGLSGPSRQRCPQRLAAFMISMSFGGKLFCRWKKLKPQTECSSTGWPSTLLGQVYDLPQRPGWVLNYTARSLHSQCFLVYDVSSKSSKEMQDNINNILCSFLLNVISYVKSKIWEWQL